MGKTALITGITGQDGVALAQFLLEKNYAVHGLRPYSAAPDTTCLKELNLTLHYADMTDSGSLSRVLMSVKPDEVYHLAAMSHVRVSFDMPEMTANVNALGTLRLLESIKACGMEKKVRYYQASSSEMFGRSPAPQNEMTAFEPCSPYGVSKLFAYWTVRNYREAFGIHASNGILFNHESPQRGDEFVTRKITKAVCRMMDGDNAPLFLGCLDAKRDWGHARDYMRGAWMMLQQDTPDDYVLATGISRTVRDFVNTAFSMAGMPLVWTGQGMGEKAADTKTGQIRVVIDPALFRPQEIHELRGDASKARLRLGWQPDISFESLVADMLAADKTDDEQEKNALRFGT